MKRILLSSYFIDIYKVIHISTISIKAYYVPFYVPFMFHVMYGNGTE